MVRNHARKNAAKARSAATGENHQKAVRAVTNKFRVSSVFPEDTTTWQWFDFPAPDLNGGEPCPACGGDGLDGDCVLQHRDDGLPVVVPVVCGTCHGCGRADHDRCLPLHANDELADQDGEKGLSCPACQGLHFFYELGIGRAELVPDTPEIAALKAAEFGESGEENGLPPGYSLSVPRGLQYLRLPCECAPADLISTVTATPETASAR